VHVAVKYPCAVLGLIGMYQVTTDMHTFLLLAAVCSAFITGQDGNRRCPPDMLTSWHLS
jgi:hypothetical protein